MKKGKINNKKYKAKFQPVPGKFNVKITFAKEYYNENHWVASLVVNKTFDSFEHFLEQYGILHYRDYSTELGAKEMFLDTVKRLEEGLFVQIGVNGIGEPYSITFFERYDDYFMKIETY